MSDPKLPRSSRRTTAVIVGVLVVVIAAVIAIGLLASRSVTPAAASSSVDTGSGVVATSAPTTVATATAGPTATPKPVKSTAAPVPQATKTAAISGSTAVPIKKELTATVVKAEAVTGKADGPGEIGGPSVRFTIRITNTTGKTFSLSSTVVNAYYGAAATPAVQLRMPGGSDFPTSVVNGRSATGVFIFNIPKASRSTVKVTVDTSVQNPVIAFQGAAPRG